MGRSGGLTFAAATGTEPASGFWANAAGPGHPVPEEKFFDPEVGPDALAAALTAHADSLHQPDGRHLGFWHDRVRRLVVVDRVDVVNDGQTAAALGRAGRQHSVWDAERQCESRRCGGSVNSPRVPEPGRRSTGRICRW